MFTDVTDLPDFFSLLWECLQKPVHFQLLLVLLYVISTPALFFSFTAYDPLK